MEKLPNALRVSQLDSADLDTELFTLVKAQIQSVFKYFKPRLLTTFNPEVNALLRWLLCHCALSERHATIGQQLLDLHYVSESVARGSSDDVIEQQSWMTRRQKLVFTLLTVGGPWIEDRIDDFSSRTNRTGFTEKIVNVFRWSVTLWKVAAMLNFLIFLTRGKYQFITERLLRIRPVFPHAQGVRQIGFEMMDRELLWHGFAEFLFFALPLINFRRTKNVIVRWMFPKSESSENAVERTEADYKECPLCEEWPFNPHEIGCRHVFCYYCIQSNVKADPTFACPICGTKVNRAEPAWPVDIKPSAINRIEPI